MRPRIPVEGREHDVLLAEMAAMRDGDVDLAGGRSWSLVYWPGEAHHDLLCRAHDLFLASNGLDPTAFPSLRRMEADVVGMTASMLNAPEGAVGTMTSGGTESLTVAILAAREKARRPWRWRPSVVAPITIHPAVDKACHLLGLRLRKARVGADGRADVAAMRRLVDRSTVLLMASAPSYPWGVVDPIDEIAGLALRRGLPMHVDACFGGFLLPWLERIGVALPRWDFRVPGVTSISADAHKYGFAAKGASVVVYRDMAHLSPQFFVETGWPGGIYASPTLAGTRAGGPIAAAWAAMNALGEPGYLDLARRAWDAAERLREGIGALPGLRLLGLPHSTVVAWTSDDADTYAVADRLAMRGWRVDRQQRPPSVHCSVNAANAPVLDRYLADLRSAVDEARADPSLAEKGQAAMYGLVAKIPLRGLTKRAVRRAMEEIYAGGAPKQADPQAERLARLLRRLRGWRG